MKKKKEPLWQLMGLLFRAHPWHGVPIGEKAPEIVTCYIEVTTSSGRNVLLPINFARITRRQVGVTSIMGHHFAEVPTTKHPDQVTLLEEEKIMAYYGGGTLYAHPSRKEPLI